MGTDTSEQFWRKCNTCKKPILFDSDYFVCSVSTCNGDRTGYVFCSVFCFEAHIPGARHRQAGAVEKRAPRAPDRTPNRIMIKNPSVVGTRAPSVSNHSSPTREVLVIASRLKDYVQQKSEYNTSASVMDVLSDYLRLVCDRAIENARADGRKTIMDRDFEFLKGQ